MNRTRPIFHKFKTLLIVSSLACLAVVGVTASANAETEINTGYFGNVAIQGYDPVAYFTDNQAMRGGEQHVYNWLGADWYFVDEEHKALFAADPQKYAPQYGGHCATGMAISGHLTNDIDPEAWLIMDGKLYLNYSKETNKLLSENVVTVEQADANWERMQREDRH